MGVVETVGIDRFPKQGQDLGREVTVCFRYDTSRTIRGRCIRDDAEAPWRTVFLLEDERVILATECQWSPA